jgi:hypothetical protein
VLDENADASVDLDGHVDVLAGGEVAAAALDADVVQLALFVEPGADEEPLLVETCAPSCRMQTSCAASCSDSDGWDPIRRNASFFWLPRRMTSPSETTAT